MIAHEVEEGKRRGKRGPVGAHLDQVAVGSGEELEVPLRPDDLVEVVDGLSKTPLDLVELLLYAAVEGDRLGVLSHSDQGVPGHSDKIYTPQVFRWNFRENLRSMTDRCIVRISRKLSGGFGSEAMATRWRAHFSMFSRVQNKTRMYCSIVLVRYRTTASPANGTCHQ